MEATTSVLLKTAADVGKAEYVSKFSAPFDLDGLFAMGDRAVLDDEELLQGDGMEDMDHDDLGGFVPDADVDSVPTLASTSQISPSRNLKRAHSPTPSISTVVSFSTTPSTTNGPTAHPNANPNFVAAPNTRRVKQPTKKRIRYNPNAPIVFDAMEAESMAGNNPLNRKRLKEEVRRKKKLGGGDEMDLDMLDLEFEAEMEKRKSTFKSGAGAFALLAEERIDGEKENEHEDEEEEL